MDEQIVTEEDRDPENRLEYHRALVAHCRDHLAKITKELGRMETFLDGLERWPAARRSHVTPNLRVILKHLNGAWGGLQRLSSGGGKGSKDAT